MSKTNHVFLRKGRGKTNFIHLVRLNACLFLSCNEDSCWLKVWSRFGSYSFMRGFHYEMWNYGWTKSFVPFGSAAEKTLHFLTSEYLLSKLGNFQESNNNWNPFLKTCQRGPTFLSDLSNVTIRFNLFGWGKISLWPQMAVCINYIQMNRVIFRTFFAINFPLLG